MKKKYMLLLVVTGVLLVVNVILTSTQVIFNCSQWKMKS